MRRNARSLIFVLILVALSLALLLINPIKIGGFERGGDAVLGLNLGLDLQGGSHLVYQARGVNELTVTFVAKQVLRLSVMRLPVRVSIDGVVRGIQIQIAVVVKIGQHGSIGASHDAQRLWRVKRESPLVVQEQRIWW